MTWGSTFIFPMCWPRGHILCHDSSCLVCIIRPECKKSWSCIPTCAWWLPHKKVHDTLPYVWMCSLHVGTLPIVALTAYGVPSLSLSEPIMETHVDVALWILPSCFNASCAFWWTRWSNLWFLSGGWGPLVLLLNEHVLGATLHCPCPFLFGRLLHTFFLLAYVPFLFMHMRLVTIVDARRRARSHALCIEWCRQVICSTIKNLYYFSWHLVAVEIKCGKIILFLETCDSAWDFVLYLHVVHVTTVTVKAHMHVCVSRTMSCLWDNASTRTTHMATCVVTSREMPY